MATDDPELVVAGAGPAGIAAARTAHAAGITVLLVDNQPAPGGQIHRGASTGPLAGSPLLGPEYRAAAAAIDELGRTDVRRWAAASVLDVGESLATAILTGSGLRVVRPHAVVVASGAMERPVAIPGWTLPGVMTVGAAQIALKSSGLVADDAVFAGSGPLLHLVVSQYLAAGARIRAVLDTTPRSNRWRAAPLLPAALIRSPAALGKGLRWLRAPRKAGVPVHTDIRTLRAEGRDAVAAVEAISADGTRWHYPTEHLFLHDGIVPAIDLALAAGCRSYWNARQRSWQIATDPESGETDVPGLFLAGDACTVQGAEAADASGTLAALAVARRLGRTLPPALQARGRAAHRTLARGHAMRRFLETLYCGREPDGTTPPDDAIACRCEAVRFGQLREAAASNPPSIDALKASTRAGMGPCQGRLCALTLRTAVAGAHALPASHLAPPRARFPARPLPLGALADALDHDLRT